MQRARERQHARVSGTRGIVPQGNVWRTWDEPDRQIAVAEWIERDIAVVFPIRWATATAAMVARAKARIREIEGKAERTLVPGSVLLAFSEHEEQPRALQLAPEVPRGLLPLIAQPPS
jgi:hypothetical protein